MIGPVAGVLRTGVHASFGRSASIVFKCDVREAGAPLAAYAGGELPARVVLGYDDRSSLRAAMKTPYDPRCTQADEQARRAAR